jgi:hypothetical protein
MADHVLKLTENQEAGWAAQLAKVNAQRSANDMPEYTIDDLICEQICTFGDQNFIRSQRAAKSMAEVQTDDEAVAVLRAKGWQIQGKRE